MTARLSQSASPLSSWFPTPSAIRRFQRRRLGPGPTVFPPLDRGWCSVAPAFATTVEMAGSGIPFQVAAERRYDRTGDPRRLTRALERGDTIFMPQVHQVLPRLARLIVALRAAFMGPLREECSFLFLVEGQGREGMGLHHDGDVEAFWLQLEGRRTVTTGPPVPRGTPSDLDHRLLDGVRRDGWHTRDLPPGTLFYLPACTPHRVVCHGRSVALSLTWGRRPRGAKTPRRLAVGLTEWDVASGRVDLIPPLSRTRLWTQIPAVAGSGRPGCREFPVWTADGATLWLPAPARPLAGALALMSHFTRAQTRVAGVDLLIGHGVLAPHDLPLRILPEDPGALDGWRFA